MSNPVISTLTWHDFSAKVLAATEEHIDTALEACGALAVGKAVDYANTASPKPVVDTGLLRNSITYALGGEIPKKQIYSASKKKKGVKQSGRYEGQAPADGKGRRTLYIGSNVYYFVYNELGTTKMGARPMLRPALEKHVSEYKQLIEQVLAKLGN